MVVELLRYAECPACGYNHPQGSGEKIVCCEKCGAPIDPKLRAYVRNLFASKDQEIDDLKATLKKISEAKASIFKEKFIPEKDEAKAFANKIRSANEGLKRELADKNQQALDLKLKLEDQSSEIKRLERKLQDKGSEIRDLRQENSRQKVRIENFDAVQKDRDETRQALQKELEEKTAGLEFHLIANQQLTEKVDQLESELATKSSFEAQNIQLAQKFLAIEGQIGELKKELAAKTETIGKLEKKVSNQAKMLEIFKSKQSAWLKD